MKKNRVRIIAVIILLLLLLSINLTVCYAASNVDNIVKELESFAEIESTRGETKEYYLDWYKQCIEGNYISEIGADSELSKKIENLTDDEKNELIQSLGKKINNLQQEEEDRRTEGMTNEQIEKVKAYVNNFKEKNSNKSNYSQLIVAETSNWPKNWTLEEQNFKNQLLQDAQNEVTNERDKAANNRPTGVLGTSTPNGGHTIDEVIKEGGDFINIGKNEGNKISAENLQSASNTLYNILLGIGVFLAVAVGMYLAIKFMISSAEEKANIKESLVPYIAGCVVIFGAFIIWKLAITLLSGIA